MGFTQALTQWRRTFLRASIALVWMGAAAIPLGESLERHSPQFQLYREELVDEWIRPEADGPSPFAFDDMPVSEIAIGVTQS